MNIDKVTDKLNCVEERKKYRIFPSKHLPAHEEAIGPIKAVLADGRHLITSEEIMRKQIEIEAKCEKDSPEGDVWFNYRIMTSDSGLYRRDRGIKLDLGSSVLRAALSSSNVNPYGLCLGNSDMYDEFDGPEFSLTQTVQMKSDPQRETISWKLEDPEKEKEFWEVLARDDVLAEDYLDLRGIVISEEREPNIGVDYSRDPPTIAEEEAGLPSAGDLRDALKLTEIFPIYFNRWRSQEYINAANSRFQDFAFIEASTNFKQAVAGRSDVLIIGVDDRLEE